MAAAIAERVERTGGARAGLAAWRALAERADPEIRGRALVAALRCAVTLRDERALEELTALWESVDRGVWIEEIGSLCKRMIRARLSSHAITLSERESRRHRSARSLYLYARCRELGREARTSGPSTSVEEVFREAAVRAANEGARDIELAARVRRLVILARSWETLPEALAQAAAIDLAQLSVASKLAVCPVLLLSPSRFVRAGAIDALDAIVLDANMINAANDAALKSALELAAEWVDEAGDAVSPLELDRLVALFGRPRATSIAPRAREAISAVERIVRARAEGELEAALALGERVEPDLAPSHARARDILRGRFEAKPAPSDIPVEPERRRAYRRGEILDAVAGMRDDDPGRAARALRSLADGVRRGERVAPEVVAVAEAALGEGDPELRAASAELFAAWLPVPRATRPARGYLALADALGRAGRDDLASCALRAAVATREAGSRELLGTVLARRGWELAAAGSRDEAIATLREAKALLQT
jgi:hypothetical protein